MQREPAKKIFDEAVSKQRLSAEFAGRKADIRVFLSSWRAWFEPTYAGYWSERRRYQEQVLELAAVRRVVYVRINLTHGDASQQAGEEDRIGDCEACGYSAALIDGPGPHLCTWCQLGVAGSPMGDHRHGD